MTTKATKTATPAPAPSFTFADAPVPSQTRVSTAVNPLADVCAQIAQTMGDGERSTIAKTLQTASPEQVSKVKRWLALAGADLGVTFRSIVKDGAVTFWAVKRITHKRKGYTLAVSLE